MFFHVEVGSQNRPATAKLFSAPNALTDGCNAPAGGQNELSEDAEPEVPGLVPNPILW